MPIHKRLFIILSTVVFSLSSAGWTGSVEVPKATEVSEAAALVNTNYQRDKDLQDKCENKEKELRELVNKYKTGCGVAGSLNINSIKSFNKQIPEGKEDLMLEESKYETQGDQNPKKNTSISCKQRIQACEEAEDITLDDLKAGAEENEDPQNPMAKKLYEQLKNQYGLNFDDEEPHKGFFSRLCPMNTEDYKSEVDPLKDEVKDLKRDLEKYQEELPKLQKKNADDLHDMNDKVVEAKKNFEKNQKDIGNNKKTAESNLFKRTLEIADQRNKFHTQMVANELQLANILERITALNNTFSTTNLRKKCDLEYQKIAEKYAGSSSQAPLIRGNLGTISKSSNSQVKKIVDKNNVKRGIDEQCYADQRILRQSQLNQLLTEQELLNEKQKELATQSSNNEKDFQRLQTETAQAKNQAGVDENKLKMEYIQELQTLQKKIAEQQVYGKKMEDQIQEKISKIKNDIALNDKKIKSYGTSNGKKANKKFESFAEARTAHEQAEGIYLSYCQKCTLLKTSFAKGYEFDTCTGESLDLVKSPKKGKKPDPKVPEPQKDIK